MWIWPRALPLIEIFGAAWAGPDVRARFLNLAGQWQARDPAARPSGQGGGPGGPAGPTASAWPAGGWDGGTGPGPRPGQWMWHPPAHRIYTWHTYESGDDWLEVAIRLEPVEFFPDHCRITASLSVACRCDIKHGGHTIVETTWRTGGPAGTFDALTTIFHHTDQWLAHSRDPAGWRHHAGL